MDLLVLAFLGIAALCCLSSNLLIVWLIWQSRPQQNANNKEVEETSEEKEARRVAAEAQRKYDQAFIDMMNYTGQPRKKERDLF